MKSETKGSLLAVSVLLNIALIIATVSITNRTPYTPAEQLKAAFAGIREEEGSDHAKRRLAQVIESTSYQPVTRLSPAPLSPVIASLDIQRYQCGHCGLTLTYEHRDTYLCPHEECRKAGGEMVATNELTGSSPR